MPPGNVNKRQENDNPASNCFSVIYIFIYLKAREKTGRKKAICYPKQTGAFI